MSDVEYVIVDRNGNVEYFFTFVLLWSFLLLPAAVTRKNSYTEGDKAQVASHGGVVRPE
jgi:hypothetical protein